MSRECEDRQESGQLEGRYANYFTVGHNAVEFLLDFGQFYPEGKEAQLHTRIITSPAYAKAMLRTLEESLYRYEETFGRIAEEGGETSKYGSEVNRPEHCDVQDLDEL